MANSTAAAPSLNRLSASTSVVRRSDTPSLRNSETTLTGSVAAMSAPNSSASDHGGRRAVHAQRREREGDEDAGDGERGDPPPLVAQERASRLNAASNSRIGRKT